MAVASVGAGAQFGQGGVVAAGGEYLAEPVLRAAAVASVGAGAQFGQGGVVAAGGEYLADPGLREAVASVAAGAQFGQGGVVAAGGEYLNELVLVVPVAGVGDVEEEFYGSGEQASVEGGVGDVLDVDEVVRVAREGVPELGSGGAGPVLVDVVLQ